MFDKLESFLAPLRAIEWSSSALRPLGLLERPISFGTRYCSVPPEAVPVLDLGVDGCHYAIWIDDPREVHESPGVVCVSPSDPTPDTIRWIAPSVHSFVSLLRTGDEWLLRGDPAIAFERERAERRRASSITMVTADGMGIVDTGATAAIQTPDDPEALIAAVHDLLQKNALVDALVLARNAIADGRAQPGFSAAVASVYAALNRPEYATVAVASYG